MKRYRALLGAKSHRIVIQREGEAIPTTIAWAGTPIDAEHIADALNGYEGAVEALRFYADPATWDAISERGTVTTNTPARRDSGHRARRALGER